jgi:hypothetical protein
MFVHRFSKFAIAAAMVFGAASSANATVTLAFTSGANTVICSSATGTCVDGNVGANSAAFSIISFADMVAGAQIEINATNWFGWNLGGMFDGSTATSLYGATDSTLNVDTFLVERRAGAGAGVLTLNANGFDFSQPPGVAKFSRGSSSMINQGGPNISAASNLFTRFYGDDANGFPGPADLLDECDAVIGTDTNDRSCSITANWADPGQGSFSMRIAQEISLQAGEKVKTQASLVTVAVPEPMTLSLVGVALLGAAVAARRRSTKA